MQLLRMYVCMYVCMSIYVCVVVIDSLPFPYFNTQHVRQTMNAHGMHEMEDKVAEDFILSARKHLFMANNLFAMFMFVKDRKREAGYETSGHPTPTSDVLSL